MKEGVSMANHTASDVAKWFLAYNRTVSADEGAEYISNLKLQKLLYYAQGSFWPSLANLYLTTTLLLGSMDLSSNQSITSTRKMVRMGFLSMRILIFPISQRVKTICSKKFTILSDSIPLGNFAI